MAVAIQQANPNEMEQVRALFREYQQWLGIDLCFQGFEQELAELPGHYAPPEGCLLLAHRDAELAGCVAVRPLAGQPGQAELKRLYVRPARQGEGIGKALFLAAMQMARNAGYQGIWLDTLPTMTAARALYSRHGFRPTRPYYHNPIAEVEYYHCPLEE